MPRGIRRDRRTRNVWTLQARPGGSTAWMHTNLYAPDPVVSGDGRLVNSRVPVDLVESFTRHGWSIMLRSVRSPTGLEADRNAPTTSQWSAHLVHATNLARRKVDGFHTSLGTNEPRITASLRGSDSRGRRAPQRLSTLTQLSGPPLPSPQSGRLTSGPTCLQTVADSPSSSRRSRAFSSMTPQYSTTRPLGFALGVRCSISVLTTVSHLAYS